MVIVGIELLIIIEVRLLIINKEEDAQAINRGEIGLDVPCNSPPWNSRPSLPFYARVAHLLSLLSSSSFLEVLVGFSLEDSTIFLRKRDLRWVIAGKANRSWRF